MAPTFNPGHDLAGRYQIIELLGVGHTAEVYRAEDVSLHRTVVVKVLLSHLAAHEEVRRTFRNQIVRSATLSHPHLARVFDGGQESGSIFMISEKSRPVAKSRRLICRITVIFIGTKETLGVTARVATCRHEQIKGRQVELAQGAHAVLKLWFRC